MTKPLAILGAFALTLACGCPAPTKTTKRGPTKTGPSKTGPAKTGSTESATPLPPLSGEIKDEVHPVICGCLVKEIGHCAEYMDLDGRLVEITDHGLGSMPFCGKGRELKASLSGTYVEGKLKATKVEVLQ